MPTRLVSIVAIVIGCWTLGGCPESESGGAEGLNANTNGSATSGSTNTAGATTGTGTSGSTSGGASAGSTDTSGGGNTNANVASTAGGDAATARVLARVNEERAEVGAAPLTRSAKLDAAAAEHAADMVDEGYFSHTGSDGSSVADRATAQGYSWSTVGENIAYGLSDADGVMDLWMNSTGHRTNILNPAFTEIGIALDNRGVPYWVQVFAAPQ